MKRKIAVFITLPILLLIIFSTNNLLTKNKSLNMQSKPVVIQESHNSEEPFLKSFKKVDYYRTREHTLNSLLSTVVVQKSINHSFGSMTTSPDEDIGEMNESRLSDSPTATGMSDVFILLSIVIMIIIFSINSFW